MGKKITHIVLLLIPLLLSCNKSYENIVKGKILYNNYITEEKTDGTFLNYTKYFIYKNGKIWETNISSERDTNMYNLKWFNTNDNMLAQIGNDIIVETNSSGKEINQIIKLNNSTIHEFYPDKNDKQILISYQQKTTGSKSFFGETSDPYTIAILDLEKDSLIELIKLKSGEIASINESPWAPDKNKFVFTYRTSKNFKCEGKKTFNKEGVYIYNIQNKDFKYIDFGSNCIWSDEGSYIAYMSENQIRTYDFALNKKSTIYKSSNKESIRQMHWVPKENTLYFKTYYCFLTLDIIYIGESVKHFGYHIKEDKLQQYRFVDYGYSLSWK